MSSAPFLPFLPPDNVETAGGALLHNTGLLVALEALGPKAVVTAIRPDFVTVFLTTYLQHRQRPWETRGVLIASEAKLDQIVLSLLQWPAISQQLTLEMLMDASALFSGNTNAISTAVCRSFDGNRLAEKTPSALEVVAEVLDTDCPRAMLAARTVSMLEDVAAYAADTLYTVASFLTVCPQACRSVMPRGGVADGEALLQRATLLPALFSAYESLLPVMAVAFSHVTASTTAEEEEAAWVRKLRVACSSALQAAHAILDACYLQPLRGTGIGTGSGGAAAAGLPSPAACAKALLSVLPALAGYESADVVASAPAPPRPGVVEAAHARTRTPHTFFSDLCQAYSLKDVLASLFSTEAVRGLLDAQQRSHLLSLVDVDAGAGAGGRGRAGASAGKAVTSANLAAVREVLPHAHTEAIVAALELTRGDVSLAIERLMMEEAAAEDKAQARAPAVDVDGLPAVNPRRERAGKLDAAARQRTLELVRLQEEEDIALAKAASEGRLGPAAYAAATAAAAAASGGAGAGNGGAGAVTAAASVRGGDAGMREQTVRLEGRTVRVVEVEAEGGDAADAFAIAVLNDELEYDDEEDDAYNDYAYMDAPDGGSSEGAEDEDEARRGGGGGGGGGEDGEEGEGQAGGAGAGGAGYRGGRAARGWRGGADAARGAVRGGGGGRGRGGARGGAGGAGGGAPPSRPVEGHGPRAKGGYTVREADRKGERKARIGNHSRKRGADKKRRGAML